MPQQRAWGGPPTLLWSLLFLEDFTATLIVSTASPLVERLLSLPAEGAAPQPLTRLFGPNGADEMAHFISLAVSPKEEAAVLFASAEAPKVFWDPAIRQDQALLSSHRTTPAGLWRSLPRTSSWV